MPILGDLYTVTTEEEIRCRTKWLHTTSQNALKPMLAPTVGNAPPKVCSRKYSPANHGPQENINKLMKT
jgi:hypothetical protein